LPKVDGKEVLRAIKKHSHLMNIPVVMLTTSDSLDDIEECYENHVNCYITKPVDLRRFFEIIRVTKDFWINVVKLPTI
jgi:DNA-binding response OmpR family regulator